MSDLWQVTADTGSPLLAPLPVSNMYGGPDDYYAWNVCPIDNSYNYACFHLPGVTNAPPSSPNSSN